MHTHQSLTPGRGKSLAIHVPTPCHENWENMTPVDKGRFCQSCAKEVIDFTPMTDNEVLNYFLKAAGNTCGRFNSTQLQRPLQPVKTQPTKKAWWLAAVMPLMMLFKKAEAQKKDSTANIIKLNEQISGFGEVVIVNRGVSTDYWHVGDDDAGPLPELPAPLKHDYNTRLTVTRKKGSDTFTIAGKIISNHYDYPVSFATVAVKGSKTATMTNADGYFSLKGNTPDDHAVLHISSVGYEDAEILVKIKDTLAEQKKIDYNVSGFVVSNKTNMPLSYASVILKGANIATACDYDGFFSLKFSSNRSNPVLIIGSVGYENKEAIVPNQPLATNVILDTIKLEESKTNLDEIVVGGYSFCSTKPKKKDTIPAIINRVFAANKFKTYPNPAPRGSIINIELKNEGSYSIQLYDNTGNLITATPFEAAKNSLHATLTLPSALNAGTYYIRLFDNKKKKQYTDKIVVM